MQYIVRGNKIHAVDVLHLDPVWSPVDRARYATLRARFPTSVSDELIQCMVWKSKLPGLCYSAEVESVVQSLTEKR